LSANRQNRKTIIKPLCINPLWPLAVFNLLATVLLASTVQAKELSLIGGGYDNYRHIDLSYQTSALWQREFSSHTLDLSLEFSLGVVRAISGIYNPELRHVGITPFVRWWFTQYTGAELGIGANIFSGVHLGDKVISTSFQFGDSIGLFHRLQGTAWLFGLRYTHYSNGGIKEPNPGQDYVQLRIGYVFQ